VCDITAAISKQCLFTYAPHALLLDFIQDSYSMASALENELHNQLKVCRDKWTHELEQVPVDHAKIGHYKEIIHSLTEQLKMLNSTTGKLCFLGRQSSLCTSASAQLQATQDISVQTGCLPFFCCNLLSRSTSSSSLSTICEVILHVSAQSVLYQFTQQQ